MAQAPEEIVLFQKTENEGDYDWKTLEITEDVNDSLYIEIRGDRRGSWSDYLEGFGLTLDEAETFAINLNDWIASKRGVDTLTDTQ